MHLHAVLSVSNRVIHWNNSTSIYLMNNSLVDVLRCDHELFMMDFVSHGTTGFFRKNFQGRQTNVSRSRGGS